MTTMVITHGQIDEAIAQVKTHCDLLMADYSPVSMRSALYDLGYSDEQADAIIDDVAARGFDYCLDPRIAATHFDPNNPAAVNDMVTDKPDAQACYWGPDQLKSRLWSLQSR